MALTLYNYYRSSTSYRVRIALEIKKLSYDYKPIHLLEDGGEQNKETYRSINPAGGVPTLVHGEHVLSQSFAIIEYLDEAFPQTYQLMPVGVYEKAKMRQFCETINADIHALQNLKLHQYLEIKHNFSQEGKEEWCQHWIGQNFLVLEKMLAKTAKKFCFGDTLSAAECLLIPQIFTANRFKVDLSPYPIIRRIHDLCLALPEFQKAHPFRQPDTPPELRV